MTDNKPSELVEKVARAIEAADEADVIYGDSCGSPDIHNYRSMAQAAIAALAAHQPAPVDVGNPPAGNHKTPPVWAIAEALRVRGLPTSIVGSLRNARLPQSGVLAHAATLHKLAMAREALERIASCESRAKGDAVDVARQALEQIGK